MRTWYGAVPLLNVAVTLPSLPPEQLTSVFVRLKVGFGLTVKVAGLEVAVPQELLMQTSNNAPLSPVVTPVSVNVAVLAPEIVPMLDKGD